MEGIERLQAQVVELNDYNVSVIFEYLKTRKDLYEKFNNEEKTIQGMYDFISDKAKKQAKNNVAMIADKVVYLWTITYFNKSNNELGIQEKEVIPSLPEQVLKKEELKEIEKPESNQISIFQEVQKQ